MGNYIEANRIVFVVVDDSISENMFNEYTEECVTLQKEAFLPGRIQIVAMNKEDFQNVDETNFEDYVIEWEEDAETTEETLSTAENM